MIISHLRIRSEDYYSCELTAKYKVLVSIRTIYNDFGLGIVTSDNNGEIEGYIDGLRKSPKIELVEVTFKSPGLYWTRVKQVEMERSIHKTILINGSMTQLPIVIEDGWQYHKILSPSGQIFRQMFNALQHEFEYVELLRSSKNPNPQQESLTEKQLQALQLANDYGYYELPRQITMKEISENLDISRSATQDRIHRAERAVVSYFLDNYQFVNH